jgi:hypothetical protein
MKPFAFADPDEKTVLDMQQSFIGHRTSARRATQSMISRKSQSDHHLRTAEAVI